MKSRTQKCWHKTVKGRDISVIVAEAEKGEEEPRLWIWSSEQPPKDHLASWHPEYPQSHRRKQGV